VRAVVESGAATAITVAIIGSLVAETTFALATPLIFSVTSASNALFRALSAAYYFGKSATTTDLSKKDKRLKIAVSNSIASAASIISTIALICVFLLGKAEVAALGIAMGLVGASYALYKAINQPLEVPEVTYQLMPDKDTPKSGMRPKLLINEALTTRNIFERLDTSSDEIRITLNKKSKNNFNSVMPARNASTPQPKSYVDLKQKKVIEAYESKRSRRRSF
jgi:hypothetical protein